MQCMQKSHMRFSASNAKHRQATKTLCIIIFFSFSLPLSLVENSLRIRIALQAMEFALANALYRQKKDYNLCSKKKRLLEIFLTNCIIVEESMQS